MSPTTLTPTLASIRTMRALARAFGHGWATDLSGPTDAEILDLGIGGAVAAWEGRLVALDAAEQAREVEEAAGDADRLAWLSSHPCRHRYEWRGLAPATSHRSGSGTVHWTVAPSGAVTVTVAVAARYPIPSNAGSVLWRIAVGSDGAVTGGMLPGAVWPEGGHEQACAASACKALGIAPAWVEPIPAPPPRPLVSKEPVRRL
jgi:hypothetical protein